MAYTEREIAEYKKAGLTSDVVEKLHSRSLGPDGKVYQGVAGKSLLKKKKEIREYYERNR